MPDLRDPSTSAATPSSPNDSSDGQGSESFSADTSLCCSLDDLPGYARKAQIYHESPKSSKDIADPQERSGQHSLQSSAPLLPSKCTEPSSTASPLKSPPGFAQQNRGAGEATLGYESELDEVELSEAINSQGEADEWSLVQPSEIESLAGAELSWEDCVEVDSGWRLWGVKSWGIWTEIREAWGWGGKGGVDEEMDRLDGTFKPTLPVELWMDD